MKKSFLLTLTLFSAFAFNAQADTKTVFLTGGQSNTAGRLQVSELTGDLAYLKAAIPNCQISNHEAYSPTLLGKFYNFQAASGVNGNSGRWAYDAVLYYYLAQTVTEPYYVVKCSYGGTSIHPSVSNSGSQVSDGNGGYYPYYTENGAQVYGNGYHWSADATFLANTGIAGTAYEKDGVTYSGQSLLKAWITETDAAIDALTANGDDVDIKAMIWHQGESDRNDGQGTYHDILRDMVQYMRQHLVEKTGDSKYATLPFYCGTIPHASSLYTSPIEKAFFQLDEEDANFHVVDIRDIEMMPTDSKHFGAKGAETFGKRLFNCMIDNGTITAERLDVPYAEIDYSDFGTDQYVGETRTWTFENTGALNTHTIQDALYLNSSSNSRGYNNPSATGTVTFADGTEVNYTKTLDSKTGSNYSVTDIGDETNASAGYCLSVSCNTLYPGRFSLMMGANSLSSNNDATFDLYFNGKKVASQTITNTTDKVELYYDAPKAGTFFLYSGQKYKLYAVRYAVTDNEAKQALRKITTDADGYATYGNNSNANLQLPEGLSAWGVRVSNDDDQRVELSEVAGVNKNVGVLLKGEPNTAYTLPFSWSAEEYKYENSMTAQTTTGNIDTTSGEDFVNYLFDDGKFTKVAAPTSLEAGKAYLSISNGAAQCKYDELSLHFPEPDTTSINYFYLDTKSLFGTDVVTANEVTWLTSDMTNPGTDGTVQQLNGLYGRGQSGSTNRSFFKNSTTTGSGTFSDGTQVSWKGYLYVKNDYTGSWSLSATTKANNTTCGDYLAVDVAVPGKFYVLFSSNATGTSRTLNLYHKGVSVASATSTSNTDIKEVSYSVKEAGTVLIDCRKSCSVYAVRFVPTDGAGHYYQVNSTGWTTVSLPYAAVVPADKSIYYASKFEETSEAAEVTLTKETNVIPAKAGFVFNGDAGLYRLAKAEVEHTWSTNLLVGTSDEPATVSANSVYAFSATTTSQSFKLFSGTNIAQYSAYLQLPKTSSATTLTIKFGEGEATQINKLTNLQINKLSCYNLSGQKISANYKGIIINNGKKYLNK